MQRRDGRLSQPTDGRRLPLVRVAVVALHLCYGGSAVEASDRVDHFVQHAQSKVATRVRHLRDGTPPAGHRVVHLAALHARQPVEAADRVQAASVRGARHAAPAHLHGRNRRPFVRDRVVHFRRVQALLPVESAHDVYLVCARTVYHYNGIRTITGLMV